MSDDRVTDLYERCRDRLDRIASDGLMRRLPDMGLRDGTFIDYGGQRMLNLSANDYLGLASDARRAEAFLGSAAGGGMGSSASRLLSGDHAATACLESELADAYGYGREALVLNSGYHANAGILPALTNRRDLVLIDKLAHASIIDGARLCDATWMRYRHGDLDHLASLLQSKRDAYDCVFIVTESIFSMDGDLADLPGLVELKKRFGAVLYVDEAHALGVRGTRGLGLSEEQGVLAEIDVLVGTFGKALASLGAFVILSPTLKAHLVNTMRPLIYSTALPPLVVNWTRQVFGEMQTMGDQRRALDVLAEQFRTAIQDAKLETRGASQIVPVILGENVAAVTRAKQLQNAGYLVFPIRPPTVPRGTARLRFSLSACMAWTDVEQVPALLSEGSSA